MVRYVQMVNIDNDKFIAYCSEDDYEYAIHIGDNVFFKTSEEVGSGKLIDVNEETFVVQNENTKEILFSDVEEFFCEEEMNSRTGR